MPDQPLKMILMGTGPFAVPAFEAIYRSNDTVALVVTRPQTVAKSRKPAAVSPVRQWAETHGLPIYDPASINEAEAIERIRGAEVDLLIVCDYGQILSAEALGVAPLGGINLHGSLLPAYRGAAPVQWAVWNGDAETGVSVIHMTPRLDGGPVLAMARTPIGAAETAGELEERLSQMGVEVTLQAIEKLRFWDGHDTLGTPQDQSLVSKAPRLRKADGRIDWSRSCGQIDCHLRAMHPWPGAFSEADAGGKQPIRLGICHLKPVDLAKPTNTQPGQILIDAGHLIVVAGDGCMEVVSLQPAGKREMPSQDYLRGNALTAGMVLR